MLRKFIFIFFAALTTTLASTPSNASPRHDSIVQSTGISQLGIDPDELSPQFLTNVLKGIPFQTTTPGNAARSFDVNQYPIGKLAKDVSAQVFGLWTNQEYLLSCPVTRPTLVLQFFGPTVIVFGTPNYVNVIGSGTSNATFRCDGVHAGSARLRCISNCNGMFLKIIAAGSYAAGSGDWILCRDANNGGAPNDDCSQYALASSTAGTEGSFFTPEGIASLKGLNLKWLRFMGVLNSDSNLGASWGYRTHLSELSWFLGANRVVPGARSGGAASVEASATLAAGVAGQSPYVYTAAPSDDENNGVNGQSLRTWADGETIMAVPRTRVVGGWIVTNAVGDGTTNCSGRPCVKLTVAYTANVPRGSIAVTDAGPVLTLDFGQIFQGVGNTSVAVGQTVFTTSGTAVAAGTTITGDAKTNPTLCTPNCTGKGGSGTYAVNVSQTIAIQKGLSTIDLSPIAIGHVVLFGNIAGTTEANGIHSITAIGTNTVTINVPFVHAYEAGGFASLASLVVAGKAMGAAKFIRGPSGNVYGSGSGGNNTIGTSYQTFIYDKVLDAFVVGSGGLAAGLPYEAAIQLSNLVGSNMWLTVPPMATNDWISNLGSLVLSNLNTSLQWKLEYANEVWNVGTFGDPFTLAVARSNALGIANGNTQFGNIYSYEGLRYTDISRLLLAAGWSGRNRSRLRTVFAAQGCCALNTNPSFQTSGLNGTYLSPTNNQALCLYLGGTYSGTCSGAVDLSSPPNRPVDITNSLAYAPYVGGQNLAWGPDINAGSFTNPGNAPWFQAVANEMAANTPAGKATAISMVDTDMRGLSISSQIPGTCSGTVFTSTGAAPPNSHNFAFIMFSATGGTLPSGLDAKAVYLVDKTVGQQVTFRGFTNGVANPSDQNCGTPGTGSLFLNKFYPTGAASSTALLFAQAQNGTVQSGYQQWDAAVQAYNTAGRPSGMDPLTADWYEGGMEAVGPPNAGVYSVTMGGVKITSPSPTGTTHGNKIVDNVSSLTNIYRGMTVSAGDITARQTVTAVNPGGCTAPCFTISANASASTSNETLTITDPSSTAAMNAVNDAIVAWQADPSAAATLKYYYKGFVGTDPNQVTFGIMHNSGSPANLKLQNACPWGLYPSACNLFHAGINQMPTQLYNGINLFNTGH